MYCPHCGERKVEGAQFCGMCGSEVGKPAAGPPPPRRPSTPGRDDVPSARVEPRRSPPPAERREPRDDSQNFAIITLILWIFFWPAGLVLNLVGLFSAQKKGCFVWMALVFIVLPLVLGLLFLVFFVLLAAAAPNPQSYSF